ncbi:hypothetical protein DOY81_008170, partial [Sarcophaga bullata]
MFGVENSTVCEIILSVCDLVWRVLAPMYLTRENIEKITQGFGIGALDGCHIEFHPSQEDATDYYNNKG